ncbi:twin-arginine translocase TatA/TatE family subunit [Amycolatopsis sp. NPDC026612]|uniref:twin-arginine translocase TatA/TatE family subunit n=1 Tax=Amycolatopsis sp. NPDC026612 TaxID=3155466 RepID=UPI003405DFCF
MFGLSLEHLLILLVAGMFILGPQRLPEAAAWLAQAIREVRAFAGGAREKIRSELGPELDELRKPLQDLNSLRAMHPTSMVGRYLLDDSYAAPVVTSDEPADRPGGRPQPVDDSVPGPPDGRAVEHRRD